MPEDQDVGHDEHDEGKKKMIGYCPRCDQPILENQKTQLVLGQLYHSAHAPAIQNES